MAKYEVRGYRMEGSTKLFFIMDTDKEVFFNGYSFMGDAEWVDSNVKARWMELEEAEAVLKDLEASDDEPETTVFSEAWGILKEYPTTGMTANEAARRLMAAMIDNGHEVYEMVPGSLLIDGEYFKVKKARDSKTASGWSTFVLYQLTGI